MYNVSNAQILPAPRFEQILKDEVLGPPNIEYRQKLSCNDLSGGIEKVTVSMTQTGILSSNWRLTIAKFGAIPKSYSSGPEILGSRNIQTDTTFYFATPIDVDGDLCVGGGDVWLIITSDQHDQNNASAINGSTKNPYPNGFFSTNTTNPGDIYFIINGVAQVNHLPTLNYVGNRSTREGRIVSVTPTGFDIDQVADLTYEFTNLPVGAYVTGKTLKWVPDFTQAGTYEIGIIARDGGNSGLNVATDSEKISVLVDESLPDLHRLEQLSSTTPLGPAGQMDYRQTLSCADLTGNIEKIRVAMARTERETADWRMTIANYGTNPKSFTSEPEVLGPRDVKTDIDFKFLRPIDVNGDLCEDGGEVLLLILPNQTGQNWTSVIYGSNDNPYPNGRFSTNTTNPGDIYFIVNPHASTNLSPAIEPISNQTVAEGQTLTFTLKAVDPENGLITYSALNLPPGATFDANTHVFSWTPGYSDAGTYSNIIFTATDNGSPALSDSKTIGITVTNTNRAPILAPIGNKIVLENHNLSFALSATDPDGDALTYSAANLPLGATFNSGTRTFSWTPGYNDEGNYNNVEFTVTDSGSPMELAVQLITITVGNVNRAPVIVSPGAQEVLENHLLSFTLSASDPDGNAIVISAVGLPAGATFNSGTHVFSWTPTLAQAGVYTVTFTANDNGVPIETGTSDVVITVGDSPTPIERTDALIASIVVLQLPSNVVNSYMANLQKVGPFIQDGKTQPAINQLNAFISKVNSDYSHGKITLSVKNALVAAAQALIADIN